MSGGSRDALGRVRLFADLNKRELGQVARLLKPRTFAAGEAVIREGSGGGVFYVIESGEAAVFVHGEQRATLGPGDHFGEVALIDEGPRTATITAVNELVCHGMTLWEFRPLVEQNGVIGWKLLQGLAKMFREAQGASST